MKSTGITGDMARYNDPLERDRFYVDGASAIVLQAPSNLKVNVTDTEAGNHEIDPDQYVFRGWRIVDENGNPLENDPAVFYDPGETIMVRSYLARGNVIHMEAYYERTQPRCQLPDSNQSRRTAGGSRRV